MGRVWRNSQWWHDSTFEFLLRFNRVRINSKLLILYFYYYELEWLGGGVKVLHGYWLECVMGAGADPGIYFGGGPNQGPQSKVTGEARIEGAKRPSIEGEARVEGAKRPRIEGEARTEGEAREKSGGGVWGGARWAPPQKIFEKSNLKPIILVHIWSNYLKWLTKWFNCPLSWKIISNYLMWRNY